MSPPPGYHGGYLRIDVTSGDVRHVPLEGETLRRFLGGSGLGVWILLDEGAAKRAPLSPDAAIALVFSPLVGSPLTTSAKFAVVSKSPLTERINDALAGGRFALSGKRCGCDALVLVGRAPEPSVVVVDEGRVEIVPARETWGMAIPDAQAVVERQVGPDFATAVIGPAGERLVRYATVSHDGRHAGRGGSGAVLGSKNVKGVAVRGTHELAWADPDALMALAKRISQKSFGPATAKYRELGTAANLPLMNRLAALPTRNFQRGTFPGAAALSPDQLAASREKTRASCVCCTIGCEHLYRLDGEDRATVRVEYENLFALGSLCGIHDADAVLRASKKCDALGLDTISTGGTIAFAMECAERGLLDAPWLRFGDADALPQAIHMIGRREGIGHLLAEGSRRVAAKLGGSASDFAPHVKGLEIPGYEPRSLQAMALGFAVGTRGADHNRSGAYEVDFSAQGDRHELTPDRVAACIATEDRAAILDSAILCKFLRGVLGDLFGDVAKMLQAITGWDVSPEELQRTARRIIDAKKQFNIEAGWSPEEDTLPARFLTQTLPEDDRASLSLDRFQEMIRTYNVARGWTADGWLPSQRYVGRSCAVPGKEWA